MLGHAADEWATVFNNDEQVDAVQLDALLESTAHLVVEAPTFCIWTPGNLLKVLGRMKRGSASGLDGFSVYELRQLAPNALDVLCTFFRLLEDGLP